MDNLADEFLNEGLSDPEEEEASVPQQNLAAGNDGSSSTSNDEPIDTNYLNSETNDLVQKYKKRVDYTFTSSDEDDETPQPLRKQMAKASAEAEAEQPPIEEKKNEQAEIDIDKQMSYIESLKQKISQQQKQAFKQRDLININDDHSQSGEESDRGQLDFYKAENKTEERNPVGTDSSSSDEEMDVNHIDKELHQLKKAQLQHSEMTTNEAGRSYFVQEQPDMTFSDLNSATNPSVVSKPELAVNINSNMLSPLQMTQPEDARELTNLDKLRQMKQNLLESQVSEKPMEESFALT